MSLGRRLIRRRLKAECVDEYIRYHRAVPPELMEAYRTAGVLQLSCFVHEDDLVVFIEYDAEVMAREGVALSRNPVEQEWQALMRTLNHPDFEPLEYGEVFHLPREG
jgi:L-rhamnose mutarotase